MSARKDEPNRVYRFGGSTELDTNDPSNIKPKVTDDAGTQFTSLMENEDVSCDFYDQGKQ